MSAWPWGAQKSGYHDIWASVRVLPDAVSVGMEGLSTAGTPQGGVRVQSRLLRF